MAPEHEDRIAWGSRILGDARSVSSRVEALATGGTLPGGPWSTCLYFEALCKHSLGRVLAACGQLCPRVFVPGLHDPFARGSMLIGGLRVGPFGR